MNLDQFLSQYVEGYLFEDLHSMAGIPKPDNGKTGGGVGYPMVATALAGIELLGGLMSRETFTSASRSAKPYFLACWKLVYPDPERQVLGELVYELVRHGLAHQFLAKPLVCVDKVAGNPHHLKRDLHGNLILDALVLAEDLKRAYKEEIKPMLSDSSSPAQRNLNEMSRLYERQADKHRATIGRLPMVQGPFDGATGSAFSGSTASPFLDKKGGL